MKPEECIFAKIIGRKIVRSEKKNLTLIIKFHFSNLKKRTFVV